MPDLALFDFDGTLTTRETFPDFMRYAIARPRLLVGGVLLAPVVFGYRRGWVAGNPTRASIVQMGLRVAVVGGGFAPFQRQLAKWVAGVGAEFKQASGKVFAVPKGLCRAGVFAEFHDVQGFHQDDDPRGQRHHQQQHCHKAGDKVALRPDVGNAKLRFHENS